MIDTPKNQLADSINDKNSSFPAINPGFALEAEKYFGDNDKTFASKNEMMGKESYIIYNIFSEYRIKISTFTSFKQKTKLNKQRFEFL